MLYPGILIYYLLLSLQICSGVIDLSNTDYCKLCQGKKTHTLCRYITDVQSAGCKMQPLLRREKEALLRKHNELRAKVAKGQQAGQPPAANMLRMVWDFELEIFAKRWARQCQELRDKCRDSSRFNVGQNIAWGSNLDLRGYVQLWFDEVKDFDPKSIEHYVFDMPTDHYTQVVWAASYRLGCAKMAWDSATEPGSSLICNYGPGGYVLGESVYKKGEPNSQCPPGSKIDEKYDGLCWTGDDDFEKIKLNPCVTLEDSAKTALVRRRPCCHVAVTALPSLAAVPAPPSHATSSSHAAASTPPSATAASAAPSLAAVPLHRPSAPSPRGHLTCRYQSCSPLPRFSGWGMSCVP